MAKLFILAGILFIFIGIAIAVFQHFHIPLGRLPGDIVIEKENFSFYFPITTSILFSLVLSLILYLWNR